MPTGISTPISLQWQVQDFLSGVWLPIVGATGADFKITTFQDGNPLRVAAHYTDAKGVQESVFSAPTILVTLPGNVNTPPFVVPQQQLNGIPSTTALSTSRSTISFRSPRSSTTARRCRSTWSIPRPWRTDRAWPRR